MVQFSRQRRVRVDTPNCVWQDDLQDAALQDVDRWSNGVTSKRSSAVYGRVLSLLSSCGRGGGRGYSKPKNPAAVDWARINREFRIAYC